VSQISEIVRIRWHGIRQEIAKFASEIGIAAGTVVGRLHHEDCLSYKQGNNFSRKIDLFDF
jgi:hypothetical protein